MASVRGILNIQSLNELTYEKWSFTFFRVARRVPDYDQVEQ